jgi:hypothetical protein
MKGRLGHLIDYLAIMPFDRSFLISELPRTVPGAILYRMEGSYLLRKAGKGGRQDRLWRWEVTDRAKRLMAKGDA